MCRFFSNDSEISVCKNESKRSSCTPSEVQLNRSPGAAADGEGALKQEEWEDVLCPFSNPAHFSVRRRTRTGASLDCSMPANPHFAPPAMYVWALELQVGLIGFYNALSSLEAGTLAMLKLPLLLLMLKSEKYFMLGFVHFPFAPLRKTISRKGCHQ
jgi:hypothetical protein